MGARDYEAGLREGIRRFNAGRYFEAHEAFEELLDLVEEDERWDLLVALVQIAVGYHKASAGHPGAARMLALGAAKLEAFGPDAGGVAVGALRARVAEDLAAFGAGGGLGARLLAAPPRIALGGAGSPA